MWQNNFDFLVLRLDNFFADFVGNSLKLKDPIIEAVELALAAIAMCWPTNLVGNFLHQTGYNMARRDAAGLANTGCILPKKNVRKQIKVVKTAPLMTVIYWMQPSTDKCKSLKSCAHADCGNVVGARLGWEKMTGARCTVQCSNSSESIIRLPSHHFHPQ